MGLFDKFIAGLLPITPKFVVGRVARRYLAGETLDEACAKVRDLNAKGIRCSLDVLGEYVENAEQTTVYTQAVLDGLDAIAEHGLDSNFSIKPTQFGLGLDVELCHRNVVQLLERARSHGNWVRLDMEDSPYTDRTLDLYRRLRNEGQDNTGVVLQAYLHRSLDDIAALAELTPRIRVCKGIYIEPEAIAYQDRQRVRDNYAAMVRAALEAGCHVGIATHDEWCIAESERILAELGTDPEQYEFQMLLGVREALRDQVVAKGHPMRVYVPFGPDWYGYSTRRLRENPAVAGHVFRALLGFK
ncbi:MAG: proline dehydrogenase family protein [Planctomycetota bacterium]|jgi:proline dehydrogenase